MKYCKKILLSFLALMLLVQGSIVAMAVETDGNDIDMSDLLVDDEIDDDSQDIEEESEINVPELPSDSDLTEEESEGLIPEDVEPQEIIAMATLAMDSGLGVINARGIPLREGPGTSFSSIRSLAIHTEVVILGQSANGNWTQVRVGSRTGWVNSTRIIRVTANGQINARNIPLRSGPGTSFSSIRSLAIHTEVVILGQSANGNWTQVRVGNQTGWINSTRINRVTPTGQINARNIPLRQGPGTNFSSIRSLAIHTEVVILGQSVNGNWLQVRVGNQIGWVSSSRVSRVAPAGRINARNIPLRSGPGTSFSSIRALAIDVNVFILGHSTNGNWTQIRAGNQIGWVNSSRVSHVTPAGQINARGIPLRQGPGTSFSSIRSLAIHTEVVILGQSANGNWLQVRVGNQVGWVNSNRVNDRIPDTFQLIFEYAQRYLGRRHVMGGNSPAGGFDCSGFTQWIYGVHGITLPRTTQQQFNSSTRVSRANARPGDLVFFSGTFSSPNWITHVGMYVGDGRMIHVSSSRGVTFDNIHTGWWANHFVGYGRVID